MVHILFQVNGVFTKRFGSYAVKDIQWRLFDSLCHSPWTLSSYFCNTLVHSSTVYCVLLTIAMVFLWQSRHALLVLSFTPALPIADTRITCFRLFILDNWRSPSYFSDIANFQLWHSHHGPTLLSILHLQHFYIPSIAIYCACSELSFTPTLSSRLSRLLPLKSNISKCKTDDQVTVGKTSFKIC